MPTYNDTPQATQRISATQTLIQQNFTSIQTAFNENHVALADPAGTAGKHKYMQMPEYALALPAVVPDEALLYAHVGAQSGVTELFFRREIGTIIPMTERGGTAIGWTRLPSGLLMKWGNAITGVGGGISPYTFPAGATIPAFATIYSIQITTAYVDVADGDQVVRLNNFLAPWTTFSVYSSYRTTVASKGSVPFQYLAIGI